MGESAPPWRPYIQRRTQAAVRFAAWSSHLCGLHKRVEESCAGGGGKGENRCEEGRQPTPENRQKSSQTGRPFLAAFRLCPPSGEACSLPPLLLQAKKFPDQIRPQLLQRSWHRAQFLLSATLQLCPKTSQSSVVPSAHKALWVTLQTNPGKHRAARPAATSAHGQVVRTNCSGESPCPHHGQDSRTSRFSGSCPAPGALEPALALSSKGCSLNPCEEPRVLPPSSLQPCGWFLSTEALSLGSVTFQAFRLHSHPLRQALGSPCLTDGETEYQATQAVQGTSGNEPQG